MPVSLLRLSAVFLRLGAAGFGGPVALVAYMEKEFCHRLKWISPRSFHESFVLCKMLPGPVAYQMALFVGYELRGRLGGLLAGVLFLLPSFVLLVALCVFHEALRDMRGFDVAAQGLRAAALVVILGSVLRMATPYRREASAWVFFFAGAAFFWWMPRGEPLIILAGGLAMVLADRARGRALALGPLVLGQLFWVHFKAGAFTFGTGLAIVPLLQHDSVEVYRWLRGPEFLDAIAFGQVTPGPITIASAFIGYRAAALPGALAAAVGMYLPGAILILGVLPLLRRRLAGTPFLARFQLGAIPTVIGCIAAASVLFAFTVVDGPVTAGILLGLFLLNAIRPVPPWALIPLGGALSYGLSLVI